MEFLKQLYSRWVARTPGQKLPVVVMTFAALLFTPIIINVYQENGFLTGLWLTGLVVVIGYCVKLLSEY